jgi:hypothetical protein
MMAHFYHSFGDGKVDVLRVERRFVPPASIIRSMARLPVFI